MRFSTLALILLSFCIGESNCGVKCCADFFTSLFVSRSRSRCHKFCEYHPEQTNDNEKWCVDKKGDEIAHTRAKTAEFSYDCRKTRECSEGSVHEDSGRCEATCEKAVVEGNETKFYCNNKCICPREQYRNRNGICVWFYQCPRHCTTPAVPVKCTNACPESCEPRPPICFRDCESKYVCGCPTGFVLNARDGTKCLGREECPPPCPPPKRYANCASLCQPTCQDPSPGSCRRGCNPRECFCPVGMVQLAEDDFSCISPLDCPKSCAAPKVYKQCPSKCQPTCENLEPNREQCDSGCREDVCVCPEEMVLLKKTSDTCVMPSQCPIRCQFPEVRANCRTTCSVRCDNLLTLDVQDCDVECGEEFCACADGYVQKNEFNQTCVLVASCLLLPSQ